MTSGSDVSRVCPFDLPSTADAEAVRAMIQMGRMPLIPVEQPLVFASIYDVFIF
jgi:hypothetical protein